MNEQEQRKLIDQRDNLVRNAMLTVGMSATRDPVAQALSTAPRAYQDRYAVACAISFLLAEGLVICAADEAFDRWMPVEIPEFLRPNPADFLPNWMPSPGRGPLE